MVGDCEPCVAANAMQLGNEASVRYDIKQLLILTYKHWWARPHGTIADQTWPSLISMELVDWNMNVQQRRKWVLISYSPVLLVLAHHKEEFVMICLSGYKQMQCITCHPTCIMQDSFAWSWAPTPSDRATWRNTWAGGCATGLVL